MNIGIDVGGTNLVGRLIRARAARVELIKKTQADKGQGGL